MTAKIVLFPIRRGEHENESVIVILNMTPVKRENYRIGVPAKGSWKEILNSDDKKWSGGGVVNSKTIKSERVFQHNKADSICLTLAPLSIIILGPTIKANKL